MARPEGSTSGRRTDAHSERVRPRRLVRSRGGHDSRSTRLIARGSVSEDRSPSASGSRRSRHRRLSKAPLGARVAADAQTSLTLDPSLVVANYANTGQLAGSVGTASLTSTNNFINFCEPIPSFPITDGRQILAGSCNPAPIGLIPSSANLPSVLISSPRNGATVASSKELAISLTVQGLQTGVAVNPDTNYLAAPQTLNADGKILGNYHVVVEKLDSLNSTALTDIQKYVFFQILQTADDDGSIDTSITDGLPEGFYRLTATIHAANHQPVVGPLSQHGAFNDAAYFTVTESGTAGSTPKIARRTQVAQKSEPLIRRPHSIDARALAMRDDSSLTLKSTVLAPGFANDGQDLTGQSPSLTSKNNFINFCATSTLPLANGTQIRRNGYCNPVPMGILPASTHMPSSKFTYPRNGEVLAPNAPMIIGLAVSNLAVGSFTNEETTYLSAPQQLNSEGFIQGHTFIVIEDISSRKFAPLNPLSFAFCKGITQVTNNSVLTVTMSDGLPVGFYKMSSILTASNHQPVLLPVVEHGAVDDVVFFTVAQGGNAPTNQTAITEGEAAKSPSSRDGTSTTSADPGSSTGGSGKGPSDTGTKPTSSVGAAVGGAVAGVAALALIIFAVWFYRRRKNGPAAKRATLSAFPVGYYPDDFHGRTTVGAASGALKASPSVPQALASGGSGPSMTQLIPPRKHSLRPEASSRARRDSAASAAPSYRTVYVS